MKIVRRAAIVLGLLLVALLVAYAGRARIFVALGYPPHPDRETPPPGLAARALAVGAVAPDFSLPSATGDRWGPGKARAVLVFNRGDW